MKNSIILLIIAVLCNVVIYILTGKLVTEAVGVSVCLVVCGFILSRNPIYDGELIVRDEDDRTQWIFSIDPTLPDHKSELHLKVTRRVTW